MSKLPKDGKKMINFYTLPKVQKYLSKTEDEQYGLTNCKIYKHILLCGGTGSGKSNCLLNYIMLTSEPKGGTFDHIFVCYQTDEELYLFLHDNVDKKKITFIKGVDSFPDVSKFPDQVNNEEEKKYLVIFDDCVNELKPANKKKVEDYFKLGRKRGITLLFLTQGFYETSKFVRKQVSYCFLAGSVSGRDCTAILKDCGVSDVTKDQLLKMFKTATTKEDNNDMPMLKINKTVCPINEKFSRNFTDFLNPDEF
jgi:energy-coupling factor transporter ATP-binding protein EcfA2